MAHTSLRRIFNWVGQVSCMTTEGAPELTHTECTHPEPTPQAPRPRPHAPRPHAPRLWPHLHAADDVCEVAQSRRAVLLCLGLLLLVLRVQVLGLWQQHRGRTRDRARGPGHTSSGSVHCKAATRYRAGRRLARELLASVPQSIKPPASRRSRAQSARPHLLLGLGQVTLTHSPTHPHTPRPAHLQHEHGRRGVAARRRRRRRRERRLDQVLGGVHQRTRDLGGVWRRGERVGFGVWGWRAGLACVSRMTV